VTAVDGKRDGAEAPGRGGYVDAHATGWTELRVHGVSGTPPAEVLEHPHVARVAGYAEAGFLRRWWPARSVSADTRTHRTEAYSWGGLTSGDNTRALWLLLLPFMLLNVAFYMTPARRPPDPPRTAPDRDDRGAAGTTPEVRAAQRRDWFSGSVQGLLALSFTATFGITAITVAMDLVGWQCAARGTGTDVCDTAWLSWLRSAPLDEPGRQLAVTALVPLAVIALLWWLGRTTWRNLEAVPLTQTAAVDVVTPLEDRSLWNGRAAVRRMRALHVALGLALPGVAALAPFFDPAGGVGALLAGPQTVLLAPLLALLVLVVVETAHPATRRRTRPVPGSDPDEAYRARVRQERAERTDHYRHLPWVALGLTGYALVFAAVTPVVVEPVATLPWLVGAVQGLFLVQVVLLGLVLVACLRLRPRRRAGQGRPGEQDGRGRPGAAASRGRPGAPVAVAPAWRGLAMPGIALLAWVLAGGFSAGVILRVAQILGTPISRDRLTDEKYLLVIPSAYSWAAVGGLVLGLVAAGCAAVTAWRVYRPGPDRLAGALERVEAAYTDAPGADDERRGADTADAAAYRARREQIARSWHAAAVLSREAQRAAGFLLVATVVVVLLGVGAFVLFGPRLLVVPPWLIAAANGFVTVFVLGLLAVGRQAYRSTATRRTVGIVWDLGTFWPRAVHPLAPPCYAERAVPDLLLRLEHYAASGGRVLLSCHSQGSVLGAAVLLQAERAVSGRTAFLTYGSPLARLYGGFFPAYFGAHALTRLGGSLADDPATGRPAAGPGSLDRTTWRWRNLYRPSDPLGGPVFAGRAPGPEDPGDVDRALRDPVFARPAGDPSLPPVLGHSSYFADPVFTRTADALREGRLPRGPGGTGGPDRDRRATLDA
jgi:hypothetical protein